MPTACEMLIHASCAARDGNGVLLTGPPGSGKSDLVLRLLDRGYVLVADDQVNVVDMIARPPAALEGLLEIRGIGIIRLPFIAPVRLRLAVGIGVPDRLPGARVDRFGLPEIVIDANAISAAHHIDIALDCALGRTTQCAGAFVSC